MNLKSCIKRTAVVFLALVFLPAVAGVSAATTDPSTGDAYEKYVLTSKDFQRVKQDKDWCHAAYP